VATVTDLEGLLAQARAGTLKPLVLIYGDQDYMVRQAYDRLLEALVPEDSRAFNLEQHDGSRVDARAVADGLAIQPLMPGPKAVGVFDARFFQSKSNLGEVLAKARDKWLGGEAAAALRQLGRALSLAGWTWEEGAQATPAQWAEPLGLSEAEAARLGGEWLAAALAQALASGQAAPGGGDDSGELADALEALLGKGLEGATLVCASSSADARKRLFKLFQEKGHVLDFRAAEKGPQSSLTARAFLAQALKRRGVTLKAPLGERLVAAYGASDLGLMEQELAKLEAYAYPRTDLTEADLAAVGAPRVEEESFALLNALGTKNLGEALQQLRRSLQQDPGACFRLLNQLIAEVRFLLLMRALLDEGHLGPKGVADANSFKFQVQPRLAKELPPALGALVKRTNYYRLFLAQQRAKAFSPAHLRELVRGLAEADVQIKTGAAQAREVLEALCVRLCGVREEALL
jgi:DNA polymerase III delta subunit